LAGATAQPPNYDGATPIYAYRAPEWKRESVPSDESGVVHAIEPIRSPFCDACLLSAGFAGIHRYEYSQNGWIHSTIAVGNGAPVPKGGSSDVAVGRTPRAAAAVNSDTYIAAIEPWHGNQVVIYRRGNAGSFTRQVIDTALVDGHALITADLDGDGADEVIAGQRGGSRSVWIYAANPGGSTWTRTTLDSGMPAAGCTAVDLNGDSRVDIACIGTATANLKWYENLGRSSPR
ncbi:MAG TPA: VCBS repeat-containing protein, partial [Gemmatimonadaceae bacterium]